MTGHEDVKDPCCRDRQRAWLLEDIAVCGVYGGKIPTHVIDQLPPSRALLFVRLALEGAATMERGQLGDLVEAVGRAAGNAALSTPGWWTRYLDHTGVLPMPKRHPVPRPTNAMPAAGLRPLKATA